MIHLIPPHAPNRLISGLLASSALIALAFSLLTMSPESTAEAAAKAPDSSKTTTVQAGEHCFFVDDQSSRDIVRFSSDAPVELIEGLTNKIKGKICYDDNFKFNNPDITFEVDLASIDTGIPLRNQHMRDNFLHTAKYPTATFTATQINPSDKPPFKTGEHVTIESQGQFTIHGQSVKKKIPLKVTYFNESDTTHKRFKSGNMIRVQGTFPVKLADHGIQRPEALFVKLADTVNVTVDFFATDDPDALK